jgi:hypothetical protein
MSNFEENEQIDDVPCAVFDDEEVSTIQWTTLFISQCFL